MEFQSRDLDIQVSEICFGVGVREYFCECSQWAQGAKWDEGMQCYSTSCYHVMSDLCEELLPLPWYSVHIAEAMALAEEFRKCGHRVYLRMECGFPYACNIQHQDSFALSVQMNAETLPEAICEAAILFCKQNNVCLNS